MLDDGSKLTDDQIVGMMIALLIAGQHTSNVTGTWTGLHLLLDRARLAKAQAELREQIGGPDVPATFDQVKECVYLEHCVSFVRSRRVPFFIPPPFRCASRCVCALRSSR